MNMHRFPTRSVLVALVGAGCLAALTFSPSGVAPGGAGPVQGARPRPVGADLVAYTSCPALLAQVKAQALSEVGPEGLPSQSMNGSGPYGLLRGAISSASLARGAAVPAAAGASASGTTSSDGSTSQGYSTTNDQEVGVDEPDIVKTDGQLMVVLRQEPLGVQVVDVSAPTPQLDGFLPLPQLTSADGLFLTGQYAIVIGTVARNTVPIPPGETLGGAPAMGVSSVGPALGRAASAPVTSEGRASAVPVSTAVPAWPGSSTEVIVVSLEDPTQPSVVRSFSLQGNEEAARLINGQVVLVLDNEPSLQWIYPVGPGPVAQSRATAANRALIERSRVADWLPSMAVTSSDAGHRAGASVVRTTGCGRVYHTAMDAGLGTVSVVSLDPASSAPGNEVTVVGDAEDVYVSTTDVYVATTAWPSQATGGSTASSGAVAGSGGGSSAGSTAVAPGGSTGTASVSTEPGTGPTGTVCPMDAACAPLPRSTVPVLPTPTVPVTPTVTVPVPPTVTVPVTVPVQPEDLSTDIYAFDISNPDAPAYLGSGSVPGTLISQYSMSEYEGYLRVATTEGEPAPAPVDNEPVPSQLSDNIVSVLEPVNGSLVTVGSLTGLGAGEEIYAVRFIGDLGYVVTFNQTDPLYVVDLSNPAQPVLAGQLSLSGYSSFLQPLGDGQLLGIGQSVDQELRTQGLQLEVFNVADPAQPTLVSHHELGAGVFSAAQYDPHALLWWAPDGLLVLPVDNYDVVPAAAGSQPQQPATASSEAEVWSVSSSGQLAEVGSVVQPAQSTSTASGPFEGSSPEIERAVVVGGDLYTVSEQGVMASDLSSLAQVAWLPYPASQS